MHIVMLGTEPEAIKDLAKLGHQLTVLYAEYHRATTEKNLEYITHRGFIPAYDHPELAWSILLHLDVIDSIDLIIPMHEMAVTTAAILSQTLNLPAKFDPLTAMSGRDKALQKAKWASAGIQTAAFATITNTPKSVAECGQLLRRLRPPFVVKPPADGGSTLVFGCDSVDDVHNVLQDNPGLRHALVEERQNGPEWHLDGVIVGGHVEHIMVSRFMAPLIDTKKGVPLRSVAFPVDRYPEIYNKAKQFTQHAVSALGGQSGGFNFETFGDPDSFTAGELGWRAPGVLASLSAQKTIGLDLWAAHARSLAGEHVTPAARSDSVWGFVCLPVIPGIRNGITQEHLEGIEGVRHVRMRAREGDVMPEMTTSNVCVGMALVEGVDVESCEQLIDQAVQRTYELHQSMSG